MKIKIFILNTKLNILFKNFTMYVYILTMYVYILTTQYSHNKNIMKYKF